MGGVKVNDQWQWSGMSAGEGVWPWGINEGATGEKCTVFRSMGLSDVYCSRVIPAYVCEVMSQSQRKVILKP